MLKIKHICSWQRWWTITSDASEDGCLNLDVGLDHCECLEKLSAPCWSPQQTSKGLRKLSISADLSNTRIMLRMRKLCYGFCYSLHTLLALILHLSLMFAFVALPADFVLGEMLQFLREEQGRDTAGSQILWSFNELFCDQVGKLFACKGGWRSLQSYHPGRWARSHTAAIAL